MNQSFPHRQKYNIWENKFKSFFQIFSNFFCYPLSLVLNLFGHNFVPGHQLKKKIIFPRSLSVFLSSKKVLKNHNKNSAYRYLPKIPFVPRTDNGPLGMPWRILFRILAHFCLTFLLISLYRYIIYHNFIQLVIKEGYLFNIQVLHSECLRVKSHVLLSMNSLQGV